MSGSDDARLEGAIAAALARLDPGPAPAALRARVGRVPDTSAAGPSAFERLSRLALPALGMAAAVFILVLALPLLQPIGTGPVPGASGGPSASFDPALQGPGLVQTLALQAEALVSLGLLIAGGLILAVAPRGPRRAAVALVVAVALLAGGAAVLQTHAVTGSYASSGGIGTRDADSGDPYSPVIVYVTAAEGQPFSFAFSVRNEGPLPVRLEGVVADPAVQGGPVLFPIWRAVWRGDLSDGIIGGPVAPFAPVDLASGDEVLLWLVATASACAAGPSTSPAAAQPGAVGLPPIQVSYSVLGFPRTATIRLPFDVLQPYRDGCPAQP
jgi:hypothetical protein